MSRRDLIDPDVREPLDQLLEVMPGGFNSIPDIVQRRAAVTQLLAALEIPPNPNVTSQDRTVPGPDGAPDIKVRIYRPAAATGTLPGIYFIHGGGMILGDIDGEDAVAASVCEQVGAVVVSVEPRDHRPRAVGPRGQHRSLEVVPGRRHARPVRRPGARGGPGRPAADLHRRGHP